MQCHHPRDIKIGRAILRPVAGLLVLGCLLAVGSAPAVAEADAAAAAWRSRLEEALTHRRIRQLGLMIAREAYAARARTLGDAAADQPEKAALALYYLALTEVEMGERAQAESHFAAASAELPSKSPLAPRCAAWAAALKGEVLPERPDGPAPFWMHRIRAMLEPEGAKPPSGAPEADEDMLDAAVAWTVQPDPMPLVELASEISLEPADVLWLEDKEDRTKDVEYRFYDPATFTVAYQASVRRLLREVERASSAEADLMRTWCMLLRAQPRAALERIASADTVTSDERQIEMACVAAAAAAQVGDQEELAGRQKYIDTIGQVPLWGLRALNLAPGVESWVLKTASRTVQARIGETSPFDRTLLDPRTRVEAVEAEVLRSVYWEVARAYRNRHTAAEGMDILGAELPGRDARRAYRLMQELDEALCRSRIAEPPAMRIVLLADASSLSRELELWQNKLRSDVVQAFPLLENVRDLARAVAESVRTPHQAGRKLAVHQDPAEPIEPVESLLLGLGAEEGSGQKTVALDPPPNEPVRTWWVVLQRLALLFVGFLVVMIIVLAAIRIQRRPDGEEYR